MRITERYWIGLNNPILADGSYALTPGNKRAMTKPKTPIPSKPLALHHHHTTRLTA